MNIDDLKVDCKIKINNKIYDVISIQPDANRTEKGEYEFFWAIYLHVLGDKHLSPTHTLDYYSEQKIVKFVSILEDVPTKIINPEFIELIN